MRFFPGEKSALPSPSPIEYAENTARAMDIRPKSRYNGTRFLLVGGERF